MDVLDEEGRLFGRVNVIDALVVVFAVVLVSGGVFVVISDSQPDEVNEKDFPPEYATLAFEVPLTHTAAALTPGTALSNRTQRTNVTQITDVHRSVTLNGNAHITARVEYRGELVDGGTSALVGDSLTLSTAESRLQTEILAIGLDASAIATGETSLVVVNTTAYGAGTVGEDDVISVGGDVVGSVDAVERRPDGRTLTGLSLETRETAIGPSFGGQVLRVGERLGVVTDDAIMRGRIVAVDSSDPATVE